ncbi:uncharacterized protein LOC143486738 [Brachyhypopomus gauderio]|uniref:uncharacterized protein LOC143486738 n=1 Tax=Brachyhypopomus gauderio TaxID=698409 RepID=UPI004042C706
METLKAQESQQKMWKKFQMKKLSGAWTMLVILSIFLMMPEVTLQLMDKKEDLVMSMSNMSQKQQSQSQQNMKSEIQLDYEVQDQFGKRSNQNATKTRVDVTLSNATLPLLEATVSKNGLNLTTATTEVLNTTLKHITLAPEATRSFNTSIQTPTLAMIITGMSAIIKAAITFMLPTKFVNVTQTPNVILEVNETRMSMLENNVTGVSDIGDRNVEEVDVDLSISTQEAYLDIEDESLDLDWVEQYRTVQRREAKWKAFGFDSSVLRIADKWAGRNLWFQQLTHSVKSVRRLKCPCVVKVPTPSTWPSILETVPEPLLAECQFFALSWLLVQQL